MGIHTEQHLLNIAVYVEDVGQWQQTYENVRLPQSNEVSE